MMLDQGLECRENNGRAPERVKDVIIEAHGNIDMTGMHCSAWVSEDVEGEDEDGADRDIGEAHADAEAERQQDQDQGHPVDVGISSVTSPEQVSPTAHSVPPFPRSRRATMPTPCTFIIVANISFRITALLLLSLRAISFVHLMQLGYFTFSTSTTLEDSFSPQLFGYCFAYQH
jgi:hypothetical protein